MLIALYFMHKNLEDSYLSTSRIHMNCLWTNVIYVPVNIPKDNKEEMEEIYDIADANDNVIFINHTAPHKSNDTMRKRYNKENEDEFGDYLVKTDGRFRIVDGNGKAFVKMSEYMLDVKDFSDVTLIIIGVGGAGTLALRAVEKEKPKRIIMVDLQDKSELAALMGAEYYNDIFTDEITGISESDRVVIMDATSHSVTRLGRSFAYDFIKKYDSPNNFFIDYNMRTKIDEYKDLKTKCAMGTEYVMWTNFIMAKYILEAAAKIGVEMPDISKEDFDLIVDYSVTVCDMIGKMF